MTDRMTGDDYSTLKEIMHRLEEAMGSTSSMRAKTAAVAARRIIYTALAEDDRDMRAAYVKARNG